MQSEICSRVFDWEDQQQFASCTGDYNPMHMSEMAARRTAAGKPALHGMNVAMWGLDRLADAGLLAERIAECRMRFRELLRVGDTISLWLVRDQGVKLSAELRMGNMVATTISVVRIPSAALPASQPESGIRERGPTAATPTDLALEQLSGRTGFVPMAHGAELLYPCLARVIGPTRTNALAATSYLVGMECPGLHSVFLSCHARFNDGGEGDGKLAFKVDEVDERVRLVNLTADGGGISAAVVACVRMPPVVQAGMAEVAALLKPGEFGGTTALVIGGSRGLGEVTAKVIAAGGGKVIITYSIGRDDANAVCAEIRGWGGNCEAMPYDVRKPSAPQLERFSSAPSHLYYFATNPIVKQLAETFSSPVFSVFCDYYVSGFYELCLALHGKFPQALSAFYPSSVFVDELPAGMTEYAMAKAAGEMLCGRISQSLPEVRIMVKRLPRVLTDQTSGSILTDGAEPAGTMIPLIRELHSSKYSSGTRETDSLFPSPTEK